MESVQLFPFAEYWWVYVAFVGGVATLLAIDAEGNEREGGEVARKRHVEDHADRMAADREAPTAGALGLGERLCRGRRGG